MKTSFLLLCSCCLLLLTTTVHSFEDQYLATAAAQYQQFIQDQYPDAKQIGRVRTLRAAMRYANQKLWNDAINQYQLLIAAGDNKSLIWYRLAEAWQGDTKKRNNSRNRQRALQAAYNAYLKAIDPDSQARALFFLGAIYVIDRQPKIAIKAWREGLGLQENPEISKQYQQLVTAHAFRLKDFKVKSNQAKPEVCLNYSEALQSSQTLNYEDYIQFRPAITAIITVQDNRLCIAGINHGQQYQLSVRAGVRSKNGDRTDREESFQAVVEDREPTLGFRGNSYILPRNSKQGLPITSVNVEQAKLTVLRINDRNLTQQINERRINSAIDSYASNAIKNNTGELVWQGEIEFNNQLNQEITTSIPMAAVLDKTAPGIYVITATASNAKLERWRDMATQWLVITDLGITTFKGTDGLHVFVRSLDSTQPLADIELKLYARNNGELGTVQTDNQGYARIDPGLLRGSGGRQAATLMAYGAGADFNFLDLSKPSFDLSDRGVAGRKSPGPVDAFLYTDRGVYRPGENIELVTLVRDERGLGLRQDLPVTIKIFRPDQVEADRLLLNQSSIGGHHISFPLADNARTGTWSAQAYTDPEQAAIGQVSFQVEDFVPQRLKLELDTAAGALRPDESIKIAVTGKFLYGAPAAHLNTEAELTLQEDSSPYPEFKNYQFGLIQESYQAKRFDLDISNTDDQGETTVPVAISEIPDTTRPLKALVRVSLFEPGGRPISHVLDLPYRTQPFAIGIKTNFDDEVKIGQNAAFQLVTVDQQGQAIGMRGLRYDLYREDYEYYWYYRDNRWDYKLVINDSEPLEGREITTVTSKPLELTSASLDWGRYRIEVYDPNTGVASSVRFRVGWFVAPSAGDTPDKLQITLDKNHYRAGETARVHIKAPFEGNVLLTVADNKLWTYKTFNVTAQGSTFALPVNQDWSPGVYLSATAFRSADSSSKRGPGRAIGVTWLALERESRTLNITLDAPKELLPRQTFELPVTVDGMDPGSNAYLTVAAVDQGILQLTGFTAPDPLDYYLGKRRLGVELADVYGKLISPEGRMGKIRSGGDAAGRNLDGSGVRTVKTVALFSGLVEVGSDGQVRVPLELPDFNGELRLMAVAWDQYRLGEAEQSLLVRDPLVARAYLPRFLAPDDRAQLTLNVQNLNAVPGQYRLRLVTEGAVAIENNSDFMFQVTDSKQQNSSQQYYTLRGLRPGVGQIYLEVDGPQGFSLVREWDIGVRPGQPYSKNRSAGRISPQQTLQLNSTMTAGYLTGTEAVRVSLASRPNFNVPELLNQLDRYPYGCLEQTTSRALPLLYFNEVAQHWVGDKATGTGIRQRVQDAIARVLNMQRYSGSFGLWSWESPTESWLSAYAMDFLTRAKEQNYLVPGGPYERGLQWLQKQLNELDYEPARLATRAYALYVLARNQQAAIGDLRYLHDNYLKAIPTRLARAQLGAALARYGELKRSRQAFQQAILGTASNYDELRDYGSNLRDRAALLALLAEANVMNSLIPQLADGVVTDMSRQPYTSTQEQSWLLLAAHALSEDGKALQLSMNGNKMATTDNKPLYLRPDSQELATGMTLQNRSDTTAWYVLSTSGIPAQELPPAQEGFSITRRFYDLDGKEVDARAIRQNDQLVALITGQATTDEPHQALIVDLLPAGLEIENANLSGGAGTTELKWLPKLNSPLHTELRDDRYIAALDLARKQRQFTLAYRVRAVTPGDYTLPAVFVEDMYKPWHFGRGAMARMAVK